MVAFMVLFSVIYDYSNRYNNSLFLLLYDRGNETAESLFFEKSNRGVVFDFDSFPGKTWIL